MAKPNPEATKLNLGCGPDFRDDWENIDLWDYDPRVVVVDLEKATLPYKDSSIDEVRATHVLEHVWNYAELLNECHRVLKKDGFIYIEVPQFPSSDAVKDPTHVRFFVPETFWYFSKYLSEGLFKMYKFKQWRIVELSSSYDNQQISVTMRPVKEEK